MSSWALKRVVVLQKEKNLTIMPLHCWRNDLYLFSVGAVQFSKLESGCHMKYKIAEQGLRHRQLKVDNILWVKMRAARLLLLFISLLSLLMCEARGGRGGGGRGGGRGGGSRGGLFRWGRSILTKNSCWGSKLVKPLLLFVAKKSLTNYEKKMKNLRSEPTPQFIQPCWESKSSFLGRSLQVGEVGWSWFQQWKACAST